MTDELRDATKLIEKHAREWVKNAKLLHDLDITTGLEVHTTFEQKDTTAYECRVFIWQGAVVQQMGTGASYDEALASALARRREEFLEANS